jgi:hypothetical protein
VRRRGTISRKPAKTRHGKTAKPARRNARTAARPVSSMVADLQERVSALTRELAEAREQQTATSEVLSVISRSPGELDRVFASILANATRICEANFANLALVQGGEFRMVAIHGAPSAFEDLRLRRDPKIPMGGITPLGASSKQSGSSTLPTSPRKSLSPAQLLPSSLARVRLSASRCSKTTS